LKKDGTIVKKKGIQDFNMRDFNMIIKKIIFNLKCFTILLKKKVFLINFLKKNIYIYIIIFFNLGEKERGP